MYSLFVTNKMQKLFFYTNGHKIYGGEATNNSIILTIQMKRTYFTGTKVIK